MANELIGSADGAMDLRPLIRNLRDLIRMRENRFCAV